ncbi:MAG TPA: gliding motility-associated C-terminal domain-containing protein, partial [Bacteroidia bacterium]
KIILAGNAQNIRGTHATKFNNLDCQGAGTKTLHVTTIVGGTSGLLSLHNADVSLNSNTLIVTNPASGAITRTNGYIVSETDPISGYGTLQWNFGNSTGNYVYPFGTSGGMYIPFFWNVTVPGIQIANGNMAVSTYPTSVTANPNNLPFPAGVTNLNDASGKNAASSCLDRYWMINANNYSADPVADITFTYLDAEWDGSVPGSTNNFASENDLKGWKWNGVSWQDELPENLNTGSNTLTVNTVSGSAPWTLKGKELICGDFFLPNAFSPNGDGHNDIFRPRNNCIKDMDMKIYNRWGNLVYETTDITQGWDGSTPKGKSGNEGVYAYELSAKLFDGTDVIKRGTVTLLK